MFVTVFEIAGGSNGIRAGLIADLVVVGGREFEINYFFATPAYRATVAHGGALKPGVRARIYHLNGEILRVDIQPPSGSAESR